MGKYIAGITEKRLQNRRFKKTEEAILKVFFEEDIYIGTKEMAAKAGVARSTFYHHHRAVKEIVPDYKRYILRRYTRVTNGLLRQKGVKMRTVYAKTLIFITQNRRVFEILLRSGEASVMKEMLFKIEVRLVKQMRLSRGARKIFMIYVGEVVELINGWCERGFSEKEIGELLDDIMYLTDTAKERLGPIA